MPTTRQHSWTARLLVAVAGFGSASAAPPTHEPPGMTAVGPGANPASTLPPLQPALDAWGQQHWPGQLQGPGGSGPALLTVVDEAQAPFSPTTFYRIAFPAGFGGGVAPARWTLSSGFPALGAPVTRLYLSFWIRYSAAYHGGSKLVFFSQRDGNNHYLILTNPADTSEFEAVIQNQGINFERVARAMPDPRRWRFVELSLDTGTPGHADGAGRLWVDGTLRLERTDFPFFANGANAAWEYLWMDPTYAGPANAGEWVDIGHVYVSVGASGDAIFGDGFE